MKYLAIDQHLTVFSHESFFIAIRKLFTVIGMIDFHGGYGRITIQFDGRLQRQPGHKH